MASHRGGCGESAAGIMALAKNSKHIRLTTAICLWLAILVAAQDDVLMPKVRVKTVPTEQALRSTHAPRQHLIAVRRDTGCLVGHSDKVVSRITTSRVLP